MDEINCKWCGKKFKRKYAPEKYCSDECREDSRSHQNRMKSFNWYHRHKHDLSEKQRWGLGSGKLGGHRRDNFDVEKKIIHNELKRLKLR